LRQEDGCRREIKAGTVEIEGITGGNDESDHALLTAGVLKLGDHARQHGFRRSGRKHDQELFPDVPDELEQAEPAPMRYRPEHPEHEDQAGQIEAQQQLTQ
jgi:hypothetical protein